MNNRDDIQSGDMLVWSKDLRSVTSNNYLKIIRFFEKSDFAHTAIAWRIEGRLYIVEATMPVIRLMPIRDDDEFYWIKMNVNWTMKDSLYFDSKLGLKYSIFDAIRAHYGSTLEDDDRYQCAELCHEFYKSHGIYLGDLKTPSSIVYNALKNTDRAIMLFNPIVKI